MSVHALDGVGGAKVLGEIMVEQRKVRTWLEREGLPRVTEIMKLSLNSVNHVADERKTTGATKSCVQGVMDFS